MEFTTLVSGSTGNCIYVRGGNTRVLVDCGCSLRYLRQALANFEVSLDDIDAVLITHEHTDHICGLMPLIKYGIPVFASPLTWQNIPSTDAIPTQKKHIFGYNMEIGQIQVDFFKLSHDAVQPVGMVFRHGKHSVGVATDTGEPTSSMMKALQNVTGLVLEANHSSRLLNEGPYPVFLKRRIASNLGHLSNLQSAHCLKKLAGKDTQAVLLAHLSKVNNTMETALSEVKQEVEREPGINGFQLSAAFAKAPHPLISLI